MKLDAKLIFRLAAATFGLYLCILYWPNISGFLAVLIDGAVPLLLGCVIAYLLNILTGFYERHYFTKLDNPAVIKSRRPVCVGAAFISLIAVVAFIVGLVIPQLVSCARLVYEEL